MNDWSLVNKDGDPQEMDFYNAACLRECGEIALKHLTPLLKNKAKVSYGTAFGSEMSITMDVHKMRKCDLVARYISQIKGLKWELGDFKTRDERWARLVK